MFENAALALTAFADIHQGMGISTARVFLAVAARPGTTVGEIAEATGLPVPRVSTEVASLSGADDGSVLARLLRRSVDRDGQALIMFGTDSADRRRKPLTLTPRGAALALAVADALTPAESAPVTPGALDGIEEAVSRNRTSAEAMDALRTQVLRDLDAILDAFGEPLKGYRVAAKFTRSLRHLSVGVTRAGYSSGSLTEWACLETDGNGTPLGAQDSSTRRTVTSDAGPIQALYDIFKENLTRTHLEAMLDNRAECAAA
jgi:DNA-binding MarR family transcriptional regulator